MAVRSAPSRDQRNARVISVIQSKRQAGRTSARLCGAWSLVAFFHVGLGIEPLGQPDGEIDAFLDHAAALRIAGAGLSHAVELLKQPVEMVGVEALAKYRILSRAGEIVVGYQFTHRTSFGGAN